MYSVQQDVETVLGGTSKITVGTNGTNMTNETIIGSFILKADVFIDAKLNQLYGTQGFGTSVNGTRGVPAIVKSISEDLAASYVIDSLIIPNKTTWSDYGKVLKDRAEDLLKQIATGELVLVGYTPEETAMPQASDFSFDSTDEVVSMSGTTLIQLNWQKVMAFSEVVTGTTLDGTRVYTRGSDYNIYYYDDPASGTNAGHIRRLDTGSIGDGQDIKIRYKVFKDANFGVRDKRLWGQVDSGLGQSTHPF